VDGFNLPPGSKTLKCANCNSIRRTFTEKGVDVATVAGLVPVALRGLDQLFNLAPGGVLPVAAVVGRRAGIPLFPPVHHFVENFPCPTRPKPAPNGAAFNCIDEMVPYCRE